MVTLRHKYLRAGSLAAISAFALTFVGEFLPRALASRALTLELKGPVSSVSLCNTGLSRDWSRHENGLFQILPTLIRPQMRGGQPVPPLVLLQEQLPLVHSLAGNMFLGPVYPQSVSTHTTPEGHVYINRAGYWPASLSEVDPRLGTKDDYVKLSLEAQKIGVNLVPDLCFAYMGYLPESATEEAEYKKTVERLGADTTGIDLRRNYWLWGRWVPRSDPAVFAMPEGSKSDWNPGISRDDFDLVESEVPADPVLFDAAMERIWTHDYAGLRRFNDKDQSTLDHQIDDHLWMIKKAKAYKFRVDAAKHLRPASLARIFDRFTQTIHKYVGPEIQPRFYLEYWTTRYYTMDWLKKKLGPDHVAGVYFFDYPMASAIRQSIIFGGSMQGVVAQLDARRKAGISMDELVGLFIDHDFLLPPYDGSHKSLAQLGAGYMLSYMVSNNDPNIYNGFDNKEFFRDARTAGVGDEGRADYDTVVDVHSPAYNVVHSVKALFQRPEIAEVFKTARDVFVNYVDDRTLVLERRLDDSKKKIVLRISLSGDPGKENDGHVVWEYLSDELSSRLYLTEW